MISLLSFGAPIRHVTTMRFTAADAHTRPAGIAPPSVFRRAMAISAIDKMLQDLLKKEIDAGKVPANFGAQIRRKLREIPDILRDPAVAEMGNGNTHVKPQGRGIVLW